MNADPEPPLFVFEKVDVVNAAADGSQLLARHPPEPTLTDNGRCSDSIEDRVLGDRFIVGAADTEADATLDFGRELIPVADVAGTEISLRGKVATGDVVADTGG